MSYYNQGPPPNQSQYPPQQGYQQQGGYPPQGYQQQGGYGQGPPGPPHGYQQQGGYGPGPSGYGQGPPGPPPGQYGQYGAPPGGNYGPPPGQYGGGYGGPPPPTPPSMGYVPGQRANMDMTRAADDLRKAMKGFGTDEDLLIKVLAHLDPLQVNSVKADFHARHKRDLASDIHSETSNHFRDGLLAIVRGPLDQDCHVLHEALDGLGTKESAMNEVLLGRSNADLNAIKQRYHQLYHRTAESDVKRDLSMKTERLFEIVLAARRNEESVPVDPQQIEGDAQHIFRSTEGKHDAMSVCEIIASRSDGQLRALAQTYRQRYGRSLDEVLRHHFSGHMGDALLFMLRAAEDPAKHDADLLNNSMAGVGTKDQALVRRVVQIHWNPQRMQQCKAAYRHFYKRELAAAIVSETSGHYERLMVACIGGK